MLLTSGQVSVALSSAIVFFFTLALFLSGYAIQQRTLREIRAAIKAPPKPSPKIFLPDRFKQSTTELEDGTIIIVDDPDYQPSRPPKEVVVEITPTEEEEKETDKEENDSEETPQQKNTVAQESSPKGRLSSWWPSAFKKNNGGKDDGTTKDSQKPMSRAERRKRIREEIMKLAQGGGETGVYQRRLY
ncbi:hypothetical protein QBC38DRAFT_467275 [Podospora fimiseda]|uniref:Uncharacterized protein n=1 Tax=Podospora fimiseda TaxID=252190 RepID=A0AAN7H3A6_9PEZI|nr:hypothetical protein QBC38DRAFT_467275 [Podospora fimiseda]